MATTIGFYFDFISPYAYLASQFIDELGERQQCRVDWRPVLLGVTVLKVMGLKAAAETPLKGPYARHDVPRFARYLGLPFNRPKGPLNPVPPLRVFEAIRINSPLEAAGFARRLFRTQWGEGRNLTTPEAAASLAAQAGFDYREMLEAVHDERIKTRLKNDVQSAIDAGVFGVPSFLVGTELFWGADRLEMVERWIETGGW